MMKATALKYLLLAALIVFPLPDPVAAADSSTATSLLSDQLEVKDEFVPGTGKSIGKIIALEGKAIIIHGNANIGYIAATDLPLFQKDTIVTKTGSRMKIRLIDESVLTITPETRLVLSRIFFDPATKRRLSFVNLALGKARFWVTKLLDFTRSDFKVKTPTTMCGVRGSDFIVSVTEAFTEVTALADTRLAVFGLADPEAEPLLLDSFERTGVELGKPPTAAAKVPRDEIQKIMKPFEFGDDSDDKKVSATITKRDTDKKKKAVSTPDGGSAADDETRASQDVLPVDEPAAEPAAADLVEPADLGVAPLSESVETTAFEYQSDPTVQNQAVSNVQQEILEVNQEEQARSEFPGFPGPPD